MTPGQRRDVAEFYARQALEDFDFLTIAENVDAPYEDQLAIHDLITDATVLLGDN